MDDERGKALKALSAGMELEKRGIEFYSGAAEKVESAEGRQTLRFLANEEKEHLKLIKELKKSLEEKRAEEHAMEHWRESRGSRIFPELESYLTKVKAGREDRAILEEAAEIERRSIKFYEKAGRDAKRYREVFTTLVREEKGHLQLVEQMMSYMVLHGYWAGLEDYFANE